MHLFPRNGDGLASLQVFHSSGDLFIPGCFDRLIPGLKTVEKGISQRSALINWKARKG